MTKKDITTVPAENDPSAPSALWKKKEKKILKRIV